MKKFIIRSLFALLVLVTYCYLQTAFILLEFNFSKWTQEGRYLTALLFSTVYFIFISALFANTIDDE